MDDAIVGRIAQELSIAKSSVSATISLFGTGATGPFIVQYRKEVTGGLDEGRVRSIQDRMAYYREVLNQRTAILKLLTDQGKLSDELRSRIENCFEKADLDDLHHQFRPRKKSRAADAVEKGLEPLAEYFWNQESDAWSVDEHINVFVDPEKGVTSQEQALHCVVDIISEWISENFDFRKRLREMLWKEGFVVSSVVPAKIGQKTKYNMYYDRREPVTSVPSHRVLAVRRGSKEGILMTSIEGDQTKALEFLLSSVIRNRDSVFAPVLEVAVRESYTRILRPLIETEVRTQLKERADREAIRVFQENLSNLLLSSPAGPIVVMGIDWGRGDECTVAVVSESGAFLEATTIRLASPGAESVFRPVDSQVQRDVPSETPVSESTPIEKGLAVHAGTSVEAAAELGVPIPEAISSDPLPAAEVPELPPIDPPFAETAREEVPALSDSDEEPPVPETVSQKPSETVQDARAVLRGLIAGHKVQAVSIGTGAGARELETTLRQIVSEEGMGEILIASVNDAGIAVYSSSRAGREEFPDLSASARCAVSLARRLQDPLSELVKIDPKLIGVGQYQHDVDQKELHRSLLQTVQYCVNKVGVNGNTAGEALLRYVSGMNERLARKVVDYRSSHGPFPTRDSMISAIGLDQSTYEQVAGFLRIIGDKPLDRTAIHPESYHIVDNMASALGVSVAALIENNDLISSLKLEDFATDIVGLPTLNDIRNELLRPGRDPRKPFKAPRFRADVKDIPDLKPGMTLEGTVTNVTNFGAFVDIGVRQDGLVHLSQMSNRFIRDPREAVKVGDVVRVKIISVEPESKRIGLSMKALLPTIVRRRKKQRRGANQAVSACLGANTAGEETLISETVASTPDRKASQVGSRSRPNRAHDSQFHRKKRVLRRPEDVEQSPGGKPDPAADEPSLQEKIAILTSKFRRIN